MVAILSEWWLFYLSGGWCRPLPTTVGTSLHTHTHTYIRTEVILRSQACVPGLKIYYILSLSMVVLNSRDRHEKTWRPTFSTFSYLHNMPHIQKMTKMHWQHYNNNVPS